MVVTVCVTVKETVPDTVEVVVDVNVATVKTIFPNMKCLGVWLVESKKLAGRVVEPAACLISEKASEVSRMEMPELRTVTELDFPVVDMTPNVTKHEEHTSRLGFVCTVKFVVPFTMMKD